MKIKLTLPTYCSLAFAGILVLLALWNKLWTLETAFFIAYSFTVLWQFKFLIYRQARRSKLLNRIFIFSLSLLIYSVLVIFYPFAFSLHVFAISYLIFTFLLLFALKQNQWLFIQEMLQERKNTAQRIEALTYTQIQLEATLTENQDELEAKVQERTLELNIALQELEEANRELAEKSTLDDLTGLFNRRYYDQKIQAEFRRSRRNLSTLSLVVVDIDHFKQVNDTYGHLAGDYCLQEVAKTIAKNLQRSSDIACRYGGEEFCLVLPETDTIGAQCFAEELRKTIESLDIIYQEQKIPLTLSCGIASYQQQTDATPESIFSLADKALYQAKQNGRNCIVLAQQPNILPDLLIEE